MKFYELIALIYQIIENEKILKAPTLKFVITAYKNVISKINTSYSDAETVTDEKIKAMDNTKYMTTKLINLSKTILSNKEQERIKREHSTTILKSKLNALLGIGDKKSDELIRAGLKSPAQLHNKKYYNLLHIDTQMSILHKPLRQIKYGDIKKIENKLTGFDKNIILAGSFRRKKGVIRDIDIIFKGHIDKYLEYLHNIFNNLWIYAKGDDKVSLIFQPGKTPVKYKADIFITNNSNYYSTILYATGSKEFNIQMRAHARKLGLLLNQNGIFKNKKRINSNNDDEEKLFHLLDLEYVRPEDR